MHIADGILSTELTVGADLVTVSLVFFLGTKAKDSDIPKMGIMAAVLFVVSLIHFPIAGTSMHLCLCGFAGILLGIMAFPVIFFCLLFQALIFQHGGLLSVGLNTLNLGIGAWIAFLIWKIPGLSVMVKAFIGGFAGMFTAAFLMAMEFQISGYGKSFFYLLIIYAFSAVIEGIFTMTASGFIKKVHPVLLKER